MYSSFLLSSLLFATASTACSIGGLVGSKKAYSNPILPGFHPDPSCIFVEEWNSTFFCATSSFNAVPGVPIFASKDLQNFRQIGNVITRPSQLPDLGRTNGSTSGIWAPTIRFHAGTFWLVTTLVHHNRAWDDPSRWDNVIFKTTDPYATDSWSDAVHFAFEGYDTSPFWGEDGKTYMLGGHFWQVKKMIMGWELDFETGEILGEMYEMWPGMGGFAPEAPHLFLRDDGYYYLMIAEGGTELGHEVNLARSKHIWGPYEADPLNPVLTNFDTGEYFQTVGHADIFPDAAGNWWGVALSTRSGPEYKYFPMGRETVLTPAQWKDGQFPTFEPVTEGESGPLPPVDTNVPGDGDWVGSDDHIDFSPGSSIPHHFLYNRFPDASAYTVSPKGHPNTLRLTPSVLNLTGLDCATAATPQTFVARRQQHIQFTFDVSLNFDSKVDGAEAGITVFLNQGQHFDLGLVTLSSEAAAQAGYTGPAFKGTARFIRLRTIKADSSNSGDHDPPSIRPRTNPAGLTSPTAQAVFSKPTSRPGIAPIKLAGGSPVKLQIVALNRTSYEFKYSASGGKAWTTVGWGDSSEVSGGFVGTLVGVFATGNGEVVSDYAYVSDWNYIGNNDIL